MKDKMMMGAECCAKHKRYKGLMMLILGVLVLWQAYMPIVQSWGAFVGWILAIGGLIKLLMPTSACK